MALIYGLQPFKTCKSQKSDNLITEYFLYKTVYIRFIELTLWSHTFLLLWQAIPGLNDNVICMGWYDLFKDSSKIVKISFTLLFGSYASVFSFLKDAKVILLKTLKNKIFLRMMIDEENISMQNFCNYVSFFVVIASSWFQILNVTLYYPSLQKSQKYNGEALFCSIEIGLLMNFVIGGFIYGLLIVAILVFVAENEFENLVQELSLIKKNDVDLKLRLDQFMMHHQELWTFVEQFNGKINIVLVIAYFGITFSTCFFYYIFLFVEISNMLRYGILATVVFCTFVCIILACFLCCFAFTMQNAFRDIRVFTKSDLELEQKLKILDFMKRFGKFPMRLSLCEVYPIDKRVPIK
ncbi:uncharacterized protein LOC111617093, partial [Centruroides sculpturatus]|uniref:uncharacterized protein LOC111617093 n=1 Tax=Centruroides sculpturatus TaxID=218467 RepID=UPI000C6D9FF8